MLSFNIAFFIRAQHICYKPLNIWQLMAAIEIRLNGYIFGVEAVLRGTLMVWCELNGHVSQPSCTERQSFCRWEILFESPSRLLFLQLLVRRSVGRKDKHRLPYD